MVRRILAIVAACFLATAFCLSASAGQIDICDLRETSVTPGLTVSVYFAAWPGTVSGLAGVYHLETKGYLDDPATYERELLGFCIEGKQSTSSFTKYGIWTIDNDGGAYEMAAWLADNYFKGNLLPGASANVRAAAFQVAIWEVVYDSGSFDLDAGDFELNTTGAVRTAADVLLGNVGSADLGAFGPGGWLLAVAPTTDDPGSDGAPQDYIVPNIPEPGTMLLLGTGLLGLYGYARRKRSSRTAP